MDEMKLKLSTKFMRGMVANILAKALSKSLGCRLDILLNQIELVNTDGKTHIHADVDAEITNEEFVKLIKKFNLD